MPKKLNYRRVKLNWLRLTAEGFLILLAGLTFASASAIKSDAMMMNARDFSWLPICGIILSSLGVLACLDALFSKEPGDFVQKLHTGIFDTVVGVLIIMGVSLTPDRLCSLIAGFLLIRGITRLAMAYTLDYRNIILTLLSGLVPISLGAMVYLGWPSSDGWFLSLCLSLEIATRGFAMMVFGLWIKNRHEVEIAG
ncbi:MAG: hypothetical protein FJ190_00565 [Gammaproteobacteria bacterium]|nr:hypothetical protein [Gammaproteobacteria bacterium]